MTITLESANAISSWFVCGFGISLVFLGLICIIIICTIMGATGKIFAKETAKAEVKPAAPQKTQIANKGEFAAAIAAAIAEELGTDVSGIKILSIKQK